VALFSHDFESHSRARLKRPVDLEFAATRFAADRLRIPYLLAVVLLAVYVAPSVGYQLPNYRSNLSEEYQPLQALKFFATKGAAFHKYGPMENFILAVPYGVTLEYWKVTGQLTHFSAAYPFGFIDPLRQFGVLHLEGRILFVLLSTLLFYFFCNRLEAITSSWLIVTIAVLACVVTNVPLLTEVPVPRPDSAMNFFGAAALGLYVTIVFKGLNPVRAFCLSLFAVFAVTAKELAGTMFVLPYVGLLWTEWRGTTSKSDRRNFWRSALVLIGTGIVGYGLVNIVYAPNTWVERMNFWIFGPGIDSQVWADTTVFEPIKGIAACMLDNLGPGGTVLVFASAVFFFLRRPPHWLLLSLPVLSLFLLGLLRMGYQEDRFYTLAAISLCPMVVAGLAVAAETLKKRRIFEPIVVTVGLLVFANAFYATATWLILGQKSDTLMEKEVRAYACPHARVWVFDTFPSAPASRYTLLGYTYDGRSANQVIKSPADQLPQVIMSAASVLQFLEDARGKPARAAMIKRESGFDVATWRGIKALGYPKVSTVVPQFPRWFCFGWMPTVKTFIDRNIVVIYSRPCSQV
jgi:hypothetical protein